MAMFPPILLARFMEILAGSELRQAHAEDKHAVFTHRVGLTHLSQMGKMTIHSGAEG